MKAGARRPLHRRRSRERHAAWRVGRVVVWAAGLIVATGAARAQPDVHGFSEPGPQAQLEQVAGDLREAFDAVLGEYGDAIRAGPYDVVTRVERCRFIDEFSYTYEYVSWSEELLERAAQCAEALYAIYPEHPEVELYRLEGLYGESVLAAGAPLEAQYPLAGWTQGQHARLYEALAAAADVVGDTRAGDYAVRALEHDGRADVRLIAAASLIDNDATQRAMKVLTSPFDPRSPDDTWHVARKMQLLASLGHSDAVVELYSELRDETDAYSAIEVARALRDSGEIELARREYERSVGVNDYFNDPVHERFEFELEHGSNAQALAAYDALRDGGWAADPLAINRVALLGRDPTLPWRARDVLGLLGAVGAFASAALAPLLLLGGVHYRGLVRRARSGAPYPSQGWQLRHAWYALFVLGAATVLALYSGGPARFIVDATTWRLDVTPELTARMFVFESLLGVLLLLPLSGMARARQPAWLGTSWSLGKSLAIGSGVALVFRVPLLVTWLAAPEALSSLAQESLLWQMLTDVRAQFGLATAFWLLALVAPVIEEFVFRGVLLRALSNHIAFGWANVIQAGLFASLHVDAVSLPLLFVFGLVAGFLARRSGGLLAPMAMHCVFNLVVGVAVLT